MLGDFLDVRKPQILNQLKLIPSRQTRPMYFHPKEICEINDELKAIYHSHDTVCIWVFKSREDRNNFMNDTVGMKKEEREKYFLDNYA